MIKKGQAATEFLVTYGWMLLVVIMVGGGLTYFGVFDTERLLPQQCQIGFDFSCERFTILEDGTVRIEVANKLGEPVQVSAFSCTYPNDDVFQASALPPTDWLSGDNFDFECQVTPATASYFSQGSREQVELTLIYTKSSGAFPKTETGMIAANVAT